MIVYLAAVSTMEPYFRSEEIAASNVCVLASFYGISDFEKEYAHKFKRIIIDSGAFTFMRGKATVNWDSYVEEYASYIRKHDIDLFFELDIDAIVGLKEVERLRTKLEKLTGKKPIPVWHISRGKDYFVKMCKEYPYVAYYCSQSWDVWVFHKIREKGTGNKWLRNNLSTMTSQIIDTAIFITIAFIGSVPNIWVMIGSQYLIKCIYALLDTIPFYYLTRGSEIINPNK